MTFRNPFWAQVTAINLLVFGYVLLSAAGFHPWTWILWAACAWSVAIMLTLSVAIAKLRREERRWNEELRRLMEFNRMLSEERRERGAQRR